MPIKTTCPECDKVYNLADTMEGKTVKCKGCGEPFTVVAADDVATAVAAKPSNGKAKPTASKAGKPTVKKRVADDEDDEDDDEDEGEAPAKKKGGVGKWLLIGGGLAAVLMLLVCGGVGIGGYLWWKSNAEPETTSTTSTTNSNTTNPKPPENTPPPPPATKKVTLAGYQQIKSGMTIAQAEDILGAPFTKIDLGDKRTTVATWVSVPDTIDITYYDGKVQKWSAFIDRKGYGSTDPSTGPGTNPGTGAGALVTRANFDKIKGGMQKVDLQLLLGYPTDGNARPDGTALPFVSDKGSAQVWRNGADSITVAYNPDGKAAAWSGNFNGQAVGYLSDPLYVVKPNGNPGNQLTKASYDKIKGGESEQQIKDLFAGVASRPNPRGGDQETAKYDNPSYVTWQDAHGVVTVTFCKDKAAHWNGIIDTMGMETKTNPQFVVLKGNNPNANTLVTRANYDKIAQGTPAVGVAQLLGPPSFQGPVEQVKATRTTPAHVKQEVKWTDGQGGEITLHFINNVVSQKTNNGKLK